jgi:hypothetical protein
VCHDSLYVSKNLYVLSDPGFLLIRFCFCDQGTSVLAVYNTAGEKVRDLGEQAIVPGNLVSADWDGKNKDGSQVASGVYIIRVVGPYSALADKVGVVH